MLIIVLPPLLYAAAFFSSLRELRDNLREISLLAIGLVIFTMVGVAVVAHEVIDGMSWEAAFVLGAVVSPTDPVAASAIASRVGAPRRYVTIVEGESLVNDATALVAYKFAVAAAVTGSFSLAEAGGRFVLNAVVGIAIGIAVGYVVARLRKALDDAPTEITISLVTPYFAYLPAEALGVSAVLAAVTAGIYLGWHSPELITPATRIQAFSVWEILVFVLNAALFVLVGLQLPSVIDGISRHVDALDRSWTRPSSPPRSSSSASCGSSPPTYAPRLLSRRVREREPAVHWQFPAIVAWTGHARRRVPGGGARHPADDRRRRRLPAARPHHLPHLRRHPRHARPAGAHAAGAHQGPRRRGRRQPRAARVQGAHPGRARRPRPHRGAARPRTGCATTPPTACAACTTSASGASRRASTTRTTARSTQQSYAYQRLRRKVLEAERAEIIRLRNVGKINDEIMRRIERDLDLEDTRLEV